VTTEGVFSEKQDVGRLVAEGKAHVDSRAYGRAINSIRTLTNQGQHEGAIAVAQYLYENRGHSTDINVLLTAFRRASDEVRLTRAPQIVKLVGDWLESPGYQYNVQVLSSALTAFRLLDETERFWRVYNEYVRDEDKEGNPFVNAEFGQMLLRQGAADRWIAHYEGLPQQVKDNDLLRKLYVEALLDEGTTALERVEAILRECRDEPMKRRLLSRIKSLKQRRGEAPEAEVPIRELAAIIAADTTVDPSVRDYMRESIEAFNSGLLLAAQSCLGTATECLVRRIADTFDKTQRPPSSLMREEKIGKLTENLGRQLRALTTQKRLTVEQRDVLNRFRDSLHTLASLIRQARNEVDHGWVKVEHIDKETLELMIRRCAVFIKSASATKEVLNEV